MYSVEGNITIGPMLFADDNLNPLAIERADDLHPRINLNNQYTTVSGLNINIRKTTALCINAPLRVTQGLNQMGIETPETCKHLGLYMSKNIENTIENTMRDTEPDRRREEEFWEPHPRQTFCTEHFLSTLLFFLSTFTFLWPYQSKEK